MKPDLSWGWKEFYERMISDCVKQLILAQSEQAKHMWQGRLEHYITESKFEQYKTN